MSVGVIYNISLNGILGGEILQYAAEEHLAHRATDSWTTSVSLADLAGEAIAASLSTTHHRWEVIFDLGDRLRGYVTCDHEHAFAYVVAHAPEAAAAGLDEVRRIVPPGDTAKATQIPVTFWAYNPRGPLQVRRNLDAPTWDDISGNYTSATRNEVERLMFSFTPGRGGQLLLWAGKPGTGKTTAVRALAREWREWAEIHYVTDPDKFFGSEADYMLSVLLDGAVTLIGSESGESGPRWRVLLLEDAGELLQADARERTGQGLSRFLNAVDGLIGQGLRVLVLVTTNEDVRKLNPAVARPGRCAANVEFHPFDKVAGAEWLASHDAEGRLDEMATLADLYAIVEGFDGERAARPLGFRTEEAA